MLSALLLAVIAGVGSGLRMVRNIQVRRSQEERKLAVFYLLFPVLFCHYTLLIIKKPT